MASLLMGFGAGLFHRQCHDERRALAFRTFCHDRPAVAISNFSAHRQADARALVFAAAVQPLEDDENLFGKFFVEADAVVLAP